MERPPALRRGWTTGACATAAAKAAWQALLTGDFPDPVAITLPRGESPAFALAEWDRGEGWTRAGVVKDAGDDPDVTHGALIRARVHRGPSGGGVAFRAGEGVGTITRPGLPLPPGEPAINPVPRRMIEAALAEVAARHGTAADAVVEIAIPGGVALAERTLNARLGIVGGLSVLGTTGVVVPYSCAAWIDTIHRGIDVARACGLDHVAGATGRTSEAAVRARHGLPEAALIDMGDFVGAMLKYLRRHPVPRVSIAGGIAKIAKLAQGRLDLHSARGSVDLAALAALTVRPELVAGAASVAEAFAAAGDAALGDAIARRAWSTAADVIAGTDVALEILVFDRDGACVGHAPFASAPRNLRT
ncbi:MAG: cobalt-precorrin-5B (C(1))-methyltransferase [Acetobacteraceae bacterium]|nr:cobalt-precorrin-5B (C(1))-methyltransferase [Acetobacteraceae bacterium]